MKKLGLLLLSLISAFTLFADGTVPNRVVRTFQISALRTAPEDLTEPFVSMQVLNNMNSNTFELEDAQGTKPPYIQLTKSQVEQLIVNEDTMSNHEDEHFAEHVLFSYVITGNRVGTYTIKIEFNKPFLLTEASLPYAYTEYIDYSFSVKDFKYDFVNNDEHVGNSFTANGSTYEITSTSNNDSIKGGFQHTENTSLDSLSPLYASESFSFSITGNDASSTHMTIDSWRARGSVGISISGNDYDAADIGEYSTNVKVTLEVNS